MQTVNFRKGDYLVPMPQVNMKFALEALVPRNVDSYFCWGFFDSCLMQKEGFSSYVFEDMAASMLEKDPTMKKDFDEWKSKNPKADSYTQLNYIYHHSPYFEKSYKRYPVFSCY